VSALDEPPQEPDARVAVQAAWGAQRAKTRYGQPSRIDPVEGWIVGA